MKRMIIAAILAAMSAPAFAQSAPQVPNPNAEIHLTVKELQEIIAAQVAMTEAQKAQEAAKGAIKKIDAQLASRKHIAAPKPNVAPSKGK